jgi:hypothetical protein
VTVQIFGKNPNKSELHSRKNQQQPEVRECLLSIIQCRIFCLPVCYPKIKIKIYGTIILPVVLYKCESWSLTLREEHRLRMFKNKMLREIFGPEREEGTGEWRRTHNEDPYDMCSSPNIIQVIKSRRMRWAGQWTQESCVQGFGGKR